MSLQKATAEHLLAHHRDFALFASQMEATHAGRFDPLFWGFVDAHVRAPPAHVVDLGTGPGALLVDLATRYPSAQVTGVEAQPEMLARAKQRTAAHPRIKLVEHDLACGPSALPTATADLVIAAVVLHELPVPTVLLDEAHRLLRPGGILVVLDWVRQPLSSYSNMIRPDNLDAFTHFSEHCRFTPDDTAWLIERSGFDVTEWVARKNGRFALFAGNRRDNA